MMRSRLSSSGAGPERMRALASLSTAITTSGTGNSSTLLTGTALDGAAAGPATRVTWGAGAGAAAVVAAPGATAAGAGAGAAAAVGAAATGVATSVAAGAPLVGSLAARFGPAGGGGSAL